MACNKCIVCQKKIPLEEGNLCTQCEEKGNFEISGITNDLNCGTCKFIVEEDCEGLVCDMCSSWYHNHCNENPLKEALYGLLNDAPNNVKWFCDKCIWETEKWIQCFKDGKVSGDVYDKKVDYDSEYNPKEPEIKIKVEDDDIPIQFDDSVSNYSGGSDYEDEMRKFKKKKKVENKPYQCTQCEKAFALKTSLRKHIDEFNHHGTKSFQCNQCQESFTNREELKKHFQEHPEHNLEQEHSDNSDEEKDETRRNRKKKRGNYQCRKCERKFSYPSSYEKHIDICDHVGEKTYQCKYCNKRFPNKVERMTHQKTHYRNRELQCSHCGKVFKRVDHLKSHELMHTGEKPHQCGYCGRFFTRRDNMVQHERLHTGEKPHECEYCGKVFARKDNLQTHERIHTGEKPYECNQCGKRFINKSNLTTHQKMHSLDKPFRRTSVTIDTPIFTKRKSNLPISKKPTTTQHKSSETTLPIFTKSKPTLPISTTTISRPAKIPQSVHNPLMPSTTGTPQPPRTINQSSSSPITTSNQMPINMMTNHSIPYPPISIPPSHSSTVSYQHTLPNIQQSSMSPPNPSFRDLCNTPTSPHYPMEAPLSQAQPLNLDSMHTYKIEGTGEAQHPNSNPMHTSCMPYHPMPTHIPTHTGAESYQLTILDGRHESLK